MMGAVMVLLIAAGFVLAGAAIGQRFERRRWYALQQERRALWERITEGGLRSCSVGFDGFDRLWYKDQSVGRIIGIKHDLAGGALEISAELARPPASPYSGKVEPTRPWPDPPAHTCDDGCRHP